MNIRHLACAAALLGPLSVSSLHAETPAPAAATSAPATPSADAAIKADLDALVTRVKEQLKAGKTTEAGLAEELKEFDKLSAKYAGEKTDAAARIVVMKAMLYAQIFDKPDHAVTLLEKGAADFSGTEAGAQLAKLAGKLKADAASEAATAVGKEFAPFKETATDGTVVDLAAYRGKIVLVDFWATWCGPCVDELPHVKTAYDKFHAQGFEVIGISLDKDGDKLAAFTKKEQMAWPQIFDGKGWQAKLAQAYGINSIPATFLLDRDGKIVAKGLRGDALAEKVAELLAAKR